jgi:hypothetical protein
MVAMAAAMAAMVIRDFGKIHCIISKKDSFDVDEESFFAFSLLHAVFN